MAEEVTLSLLVERYGLSEEMYHYKISDEHLGDISLSYCSRWRDLPSRLGMKKIVVDDLDKNHTLVDEDMKRSSFFSKWKEAKGSRATYKALISALLQIKCVEDAEGVCELLKNSPPSSETVCDHLLGPLQPALPSTSSETAPSLTVTFVAGNIGIREVLVT